MFVAKFIVPVTRRIHIEIPKFSARGQRCGDTKALCKKLRHIKTEQISPKCKEYKEKLANCSRSSKERISCKKIFFKSIPKCGTKSIADEYQKAYQDVTKQAETILNDMHRDSKSIFDQLKKDIEMSNQNEQIMLQGILQDIKKVLQKLLALDPSFGSLKRKSAMSLSHEVRQAFDEVDHDTLPRIQRLKGTIENLEQDVLSCIDRAKSLVLSCRKCKNPATLAKCVEENTNYAEKILEKTSQNAQSGLMKVETLQREILKYHKASLTDISNDCREKSQAFLKHLNDCVYAAKRVKQ